MNLGNMFAILLAATAAGASLASADTLQTHRIPAALAVEAATEAVDACAKQGYRETAVVVDADGVTIAAVRGDGAGPTRSIARTTRHIPAHRLRTTRSPLSND